MIDQSIDRYATSFNGLNILIIDNDVQLCTDLTKYFLQKGCFVSTEIDETRAIALIDSNKFNIILADLNLHKSFRQEIISHSSSRHPEIPVIVIADMGNVDKALEALQYGAWDFIIKPILNFDILKISVHRALEKNQLLRENKTYRENLENLIEKKTGELLSKTRELQRINTELNEARIKAENSDKFKSEFIAQISHEIRTPVNAIVSFTNLLKTDLEDHLTDELREGFLIIERSGERIVRTIDLLIDVSQALSGSYTRSLSEINVVEVIETLICEKRQKINNNVSLVFHKNVESYYTKLDNYSFNQILCNIIDNSIKFTHNGEIKIELITNGSNNLSVKVNDTGIGMSKDYLEEIFKPFSQEDQGCSRQYDGNGLGMTLVKKFCHLNNIELDIQSVKGKGTQVTLILPSTERKG